MYRQYRGTTRILLFQITDITRYVDVSQNGYCYVSDFVSYIVDNYFKFRPNLLFANFVLGLIVFSDFFSL